MSQIETKQFIAGADTVRGLVYVGADGRVYASGAFPLLVAGADFQEGQELEAEIKGATLNVARAVAAQGEP